MDRDLGILIQSTVSAIINNSAKLSFYLCEKSEKCDLTPDARFRRYRQTRDHKAKIISISDPSQAGDMGNMPLYPISIK